MSFEKGYKLSFFFGGGGGLQLTLKHCTQHADNKRNSTSNNIELLNNILVLSYMETKKRHFKTT